jgi:uncharacterized protein DUF397
MSLSKSRSRRWRKSSFSDGTGQGGCVEIAPTPGTVSVRDSKSTSGGELTLPAAAWHQFLLALTQ